MTDEFQTLASEHRHEPERVKGSRFLASAAPASTVEEAQRFVAIIRAEFANATHHCWAYRIGGAGDVFRFSDDGEPGGSAGRPILAQIEGHGLTNTVVVVTRWFGGTKLGVGGLMRAYGGAAGQALDRAPLRTVIVTCRLLAEHPYECSGAIRGVLAAHGLTALEAEYARTVRLELEVPERAVESLIRDLLDASAGRASIERRS